MIIRTVPYIRHAHGNHRSNRIWERPEILEVCTGSWDPKLDIHSFQVLQLLIPTPQYPWKCTAQQLQLTRCTTHTQYYTIPVGLGRQPPRESFYCYQNFGVEVFLSTSEFSYQPTTVLLQSHSMRKLLLFFSWSQWVILHTHKLLQAGWLHITRMN